MTDPGTHVLVREYNDITNAPGVVSGVDKHRVATIFSEQSWDYVMWLPEWILASSERDLITVESSDHLVVGDVTDYSEDAWEVVQPHRDGEDGLGSPGGYVPKSQVVVFERARGVERVESPQRGLSDYEGVEQ